jgi:hypothetical protein
MITFELPTSIVIPRKTMEDKRIALNLNVFRNLHHSVNNQMKQSFRPDKIEIFRAEKIRISYHVEKMSKRKFDTFNIVSVVDKFFLDWLVSHKMIPDDTFNNVEYGTITGNNNCKQSRVIAQITIIGEE